MISFSTIWTVVLRYFYVNARDVNKFIDLTYWPLIDIFMFGFTGISFIVDKNPQIIFAFLTAIVLQQVIFRTNIEISQNLLAEFWDNNLINLLASPVSVIEWLLGLMLTGLLTMLFTVPFSILCIYLIYGYNIFSLGFPLLLFIAMLAISGWTLGLISSGLLIWQGQRIQSVVWAIGWLFIPFCSAFYPLEMLPTWMQYVGKCLPMTYVFETMRTLVFSDVFDWYGVLIGFCLNFLYFALAVLLFHVLLQKSKNKGLASL